MNFSQCMKSEEWLGFFCQAINVLQKIPVFTVLSIFFLFLKVSLSVVMQLHLYSTQCLAKLYCNKHCVTIFVLILHMWNQLLH